jgi:hypothetical protein
LQDEKVWEPLEEWIDYDRVIIIITHIAFGGSYANNLIGML